MSQLFTSDQFVKRCGITMSTLKALHRKGFKCHAPSTGKRARALYSNHDVQKIQRYLKAPIDARWAALEGRGYWVSTETGNKSK